MSVSLARPSSASPLTKQVQPIRPIAFWQLLLLFGLPGAIMYAGVYLGVPYSLARTGSAFPGMALALTGACALVFFLSLYLYRLEGNPLTWAALKIRFRLTPLSGKQWLLVLALFVVAQTIETLIVLSGISLSFIPFFRAPDFIPFPVNTAGEVTFPLKEFLGAALPGAWWMILYWFIHVFFNIIGEEFMWRGYLLPRMELSYGKWAWVINGLLWGFLGHAFMKWHYIGMLPTILITPWLAQKTKSIWATIAFHGIGNAIMIFVLIPGILAAH